MGAAGTIGSLGNYAGIVAAYVQLILSHLAFDIQFEMDGPPPLIRTTAAGRSHSGETKTLIATVKMDVGKVQWINCFRIVLNAMGLDFKVDNNGPVKGASVSWEGISGFSDAAIYRGGPEQLVRFVNDPGSRIQTGGAITPHNTITDQLTDKDGKARVNVEGVGQRENLGSQPRPVMKQATAGAMVALKPADMYRDLKDAGATALGGFGTMPAELLYRTHWSFGGWYTFPVQDWKVGNGWSGTVTYTRVERRTSGSKSQSVCCGGRPVYLEDSDEREDTVEQRWEIPNNSDSASLTPGFSMATAMYTLTARATKVEKSHHTGWASCRGGSHPETSTSHERTESGKADYSETAQVTVRLESDGSFLINGGGPPGQPVGEMKMTEKNDRNNGCNGQEPTRTRSLTGTYRPGAWAANIEGTADPDADTLEGTLIRVEKHPGANTTISHIYNWELHR
jgi:hypothetical protein